MQQILMRDFMRRIASAGSLVAVAAIAFSGCNGSDDSGGPQTQPTATPVATSVPNATATPGARPTATRTPVAGATIFTTLSTSGTFAGGRFTQTSGSFQKVSGRPRPGPTPAPTTAPPPPTGPTTVVIYSGTFTLSSGQGGQFTFTVTPDNRANGSGIPPELFRFEMNPVPVETGSATVSLQVLGSTGTGTVQLSNGERGTITITRRSEVSAQSRR